MTPRTRPDLASIPAYVPGRTVPNAVKLASNETTLGPLPSVLDAILQAAATVNRYPDNGSAELIAALAARLDMSADRIAVGCGSVSLCQELVQITCNDGDEVIYSWRSFEAYPVVCAVAGATAVPVPNTPDHGHDLKAMLAAITDRTRLIFVCNPNNPTGSCLGKDELEQFLDAVPSHIVVALDEAYFEYMRAAPGEDLPDGISLAAGRRNVVVLRTFSKAYGLAGLRVGYAVADPEIIVAMSKVHTTFSVNSLAQRAAIASLEAAGELLARTEGVLSERERVRAALIEAGYVVPPSEANFVWLPLGERSAAFSAAAAEAGVILRNFTGEGVRISIGDPHENDLFVAYATGAGRELAGVA
ncbi:histidinol-phosphate transaminase [Rhodococcus sp. HNM0563]|uniref:histidinol-phosphate transaminase n=1 Tax=unclassified Rhodococcus (in: high G+C Gram-positive bacteria) TaxID=192944 RepID=UPI00146F3218|nr:histidinol-phosphate transaminase [Rhodococcus sp. F64268]MCK0091191.1 histidinol-phosphate transaminase [Rhodococcus sp. F64268]NLU63920.1 histidinol-phosphate transaminase [Rhodococcus sp. HNM0563]